MKENTKKSLDSLTPEMIDKTMKKMKTVNAPDDISSERIKNNVLAATGLVKESEKKSKKMHFSGFTNWMPAAAACLVLIVAAAIIIPSVLNGHKPVNPPVGSDPPVHSEDPDNPPVNTFKIDSLDKMTFYAAEKLLKSMGKAASRGYDTKSCECPEDILIDVFPPDYVVAPKDGNDGNVILPDSNSAFVDSYSVDPDEVFEIYKVIRFNINLTDETNPIAEHLGTGIISVTITQNTLMDMITFEKEGRFYSVIDRTLYDSYVRFYSIKYIDGFNVCKLQPADYADFHYYVFDILYEEEAPVSEIGQINNIDGFKIGLIDLESADVTREIPSVYSDVEVVVGSVEIAEGCETFTLRELEALYNTAE